MLSQGQALTHPTQTSILKFNHFSDSEKDLFQNKTLFGVAPKLGGWEVLPILHHPVRGDL